MPDHQDRPLHVFLCHAKEDKFAVHELSQRLKTEGWVDPWLDEERLLPGQDWDLEIQKQLDAADAVIVFLSDTAMKKEGYVHKELRLIYDISMSKPEGTIFVIPFRLEDCQPPRRFKLWQWGNYFGENKEATYQDLLCSLKERYQQKLQFEAEKRLREEKALAEITSLLAGTIQSIRKKYNVQPGKISPLPSSHTIYKFGEVEFVKVPAGKFLMGSSDSDKQAHDAEKPQHVVDLPYDFYIARFPITSEQFAAYLQAKGVKDPESKWQFPWEHDHPVVDVSWKDAMAYCQWLNDLRKGELPSGLILRLPTEAEWEKAARGVQGNMWPWGNIFDKSKCNTLEHSEIYTTPVGTYSPHGDAPYGCADMSGNVWEWTHSLSRDYPYDAQDGRESESVEDSRVLRGGSFAYGKEFARCASRRSDFFHPPIRTGFRVAVAPPLS